MRKSTAKPNRNSLDCPQGVDPAERKLLLQKIIDGQANLEEERQFFKTLENCEKCICREQCDQHIEIRQILKESIVNKPLPAGLVDQIKTKVERLAEDKK